MEKYAINEIMLAQDIPSERARLIERKQMDISWWYELKDIDRDARAEIYHLWIACVRHCRCVGGDFSTYKRENGVGTVTTYGLATDLGYLDMLFTDLFTQMVAKLRPKYDASKSLGENAFNAKAAGMKYADVALWLGRPDWVRDGKPVDNGVIKRAVKQYAAESGREYIAGQPGTYQWSYVSGFCTSIRVRFGQMRDARKSENTGGMELALRDVIDLAREALWEDFPSLRPHPEDCKCKICSAKAKPVKYRSRMSSQVGSAAGHEAGKAARIVSNDPNVRSGSKRQLG